MDFTEYQNKAWKTAIYNNKGDNLDYATHGLTSEVGEVAGKVKRIHRDGYTKNDIRLDVMQELGDVLWYIAAICMELNLSMDEVAEYNIKKLYSRNQRGVISGEGDNR